MAAAVVGLVAVALGEPPRLAVAATLAAAGVGGIVALGLARRLMDDAEELEHHRQGLRRALVRLGDALGASGDRRALVQVVLETTRELVDADGAVFWMDVGPAVVARAEAGEAAVDGHRLRSGAGVVGRAAASGEPATWPGEGPGPDPLEPSAGAVLAVPLEARGRLYGVLALHRRPGRGAFGAGDLDDVLGVARQAEAAIDRSFHHDETRRLSLTDGLTGLWNRRQFELRIAQEVERATRFGERFSVVLIDLDGFKAVNDTHGHLVGDAVLVETAQRLVTHTREVDLVARFGGEEFVLLLPQTDADGAVLVAEKVRSEVAAEAMATDVGPLVVTLSAGVASHPEHGSTLTSLLTAADTALYEAKGSGKNRVVLADLADLADLPDDPGATSP